VSWRRLPAEVVLTCGLRPGHELDRPALRRLRAELRRVEALEAAGKALRHRDLPASRVGAELERRGVAPAERRRALSTLERAGVVDDRRVAIARAAALAERGYGDEAIRSRLGEVGIAEGLVEEAMALLEPETARAQRVLDREGASTRTLRLLARRGFGEDVLEWAAWQTGGTALG
jgi:SOS response regulatory protein OraA/RecX